MLTPSSPLSLFISLSPFLSLLSLLFSSPALTQLSPESNTWNFGAFSEGKISKKSLMSTQFSTNTLRTIAARAARLLKRLRLPEAVLGTIRGLKVAAAAEVLLAASGVLLFFHSHFVSQVAATAAAIGRPRSPAAQARPVCPLPAPSWSGPRRLPGPNPPRIRPRGGPGAHYPPGGASAQLLSGVRL